MDKLELYTLSTKLNSLVSYSKAMLTTNGCRYKHFVDNSDLGHDCTYSRITRRYYEEEQEALSLSKLLHAIIDEAQTALAQIEATQPASQSKASEDGS